MLAGLLSTNFYFLFFLTNVYEIKPDVHDHEFVSLLPAKCIVGDPPTTIDPWWPPAVQLYKKSSVFVLTGDFVVS